jgi:uncharacterized protein (TIGR00255 family)
MKSMTAYASVSFPLQSKRYRLEIQSLNKKGLEIQTDLPQSFLNLNIPIRLLVSNKLERGTVLVRLKEESAEKQVLNIDELKSLKTVLQTTAEQLGFSKESINFSMLLDKSQISSVFDVSFEDIESFLTDCLKNLVDMRNDEGQRLKKDLLARFDFILKSVDEVEKFQESVPSVIKQNLLERIAALGLQGHDEERILKEVIYYVEKQDVTEEITRLKSHVVQMRALCETDQAVGRKLEFLTQECFRELNTLCAKTSQLPSINLTLVLKAEFEKIKEQIMNIE